MGTASATGGLAVIAWVFTALLLLLALVSMAAARGSLKTNFLLGIRTPRLKRSESAWRAGHAAAVPQAWSGFALAIIFAACGFIVPSILWAVVIVFIITVIRVPIIATRAADKAP